ncbi:hypothetical protein Tco_0886163 [Tanacetum coccineum]
MISMMLRLMFPPWLGVTLVPTLQLTPEPILSWLLVGGYLEENVVLMKVIALFRLAIGSSEGKNDGTTSPESSCGNDACDC